MKEPFIVTIRMEQAAQMLTSAFATSQLELTETANKAIEQALKEFDLEKYLKTEAERIIKAEASKIVERYFTWGDGRKALEKVIHEQLKENADKY